MSRKRTFSATIEGNDKGGAFVTVPFDVEEAFGSKRPKVTATIDGIAYHGTLVRMGSPDHFLLVRKDIRGQIGKQAGDDVDVTVELDTEPRVVTMPDDFDEALRPFPEARAYFDGLSYTHQKEYVRWIVEAKRAKTRERRLKKAVEMLRNEVRTPDRQT